jgi:uncharacterized RDD family membrane protein YckC
MTGANLGQWIQDNVITVILLLIAVIVLWKGKSGNISAVVTIITCLLLGLMVLALATTPAGPALGKWFVELFTV